MDNYSANSAGKRHEDLCEARISQVYRAPKSPHFYDSRTVHKAITGNVRVERSLGRARSAATRRRYSRPARETY